MCEFSFNTPSPFPPEADPSFGGREKVGMRVMKRKIGFPHLYPCLSGRQALPEGEENSHMALILSLLAPALGIEMGVDISAGIRRFYFFYQLLCQLMRVQKSQVLIELNMKLDKFFVPDSAGSQIMNPQH